MNIYVKAPAARLHYARDWGAIHGAEQSILSSEWRVEPDENDGLVVVEDALDGQVASVAVSGGKAGCSYDLVNRITLLNGDIDERAISFRVEAR